MLNLLLVLVAIVFALQAVRCTRLVRSALWLAGVSGMLSILLYRLGAHEVAVIELSVGAGLVTVLMVFAIAIAGEDDMDQLPSWFDGSAWATVPRWLAAVLVAVFLLAAGALVLPASEPALGATEASFSVTLWQERGLDALVQVGLIFAGTLGVLGLLSEKETAAVPDAASAEEKASDVIEAGGATS